MITIKSNTEIELMKKAGVINAAVMDALRKAVKPGINTMELDSIAKDVMKAHNVVPAFLNYGGFPGRICTSVNEQIVHGIPSENVILKDGDIISLDMGVFYEGYCADMADTLPVGTISLEAQALIDTTRQSFFEGLTFCKEGYRLYDISHAIQTYAEDKGYGVVRDYVGHGIGTAMHEDPAVPNFGPAGRGVRLQKGMALAIEPMLNQGTWKVRVLDDGWTVVTKDKQLSAHYEHTVIITDGEPILTTLV